jgi:hypothetical protein
MIFTSGFQSYLMTGIALLIMSPYVLVQRMFTKLKLITALS